MNQSNSSIESSVLITESSFSAEQKIPCINGCTSLEEAQKLLHRSTTIFSSFSVPKTEFQIHDFRPNKKTEMITVLIGPNQPPSEDHKLRMFCMWSGWNQEYCTRVKEVVQSGSGIKCFAFPIVAHQAFTPTISAGLPLSDVNPHWITFEYGPRDKQQHYSCDSLPPQEMEPYFQEEELTTNWHSMDDPVRYVIFGSSIYSF
jgi:hypothetical protein